MVSGEASRRTASGFSRVWPLLPVLRSVATRSLAIGAPGGSLTPNDDRLRIATERRVGNESRAHLFCSAMPVCTATVHASASVGTVNRLILAPTRYSTHVSPARRQCAVRPYANSTRAGTAIECAIYSVFPKISIDVVEARLRAF